MDTLKPLPYPMATTERVIRHGPYPELTWSAVLVGYFLEVYQPFGSRSVYLQTAAYSATVLFHMIPAITDFLRRLPVGDPFVDSLDDPLVQSFHLAFLAVFVCGVLLQWRLLRNLPEAE